MKFKVITINLLYLSLFDLNIKRYVNFKEVKTNRIAKACASKLKNVKEAILLPKDTNNEYYCN